MDFFKKLMKRIGFVVTVLFFVICITGTSNVKASDTVSIEQKRVVNLHSLTYTSSEVSFAWDAIAGADGYEIWKLNTLTNGYDLVCETKENTYKFSELNSGIKMNILVRAFTKSGEDKDYGIFSDMLVLSTIPGDVTNLQAASSGSALIVLSWNEVSVDASYIIYRCTEGSYNYTQIANTSEETYTDVNVLPATGYSYYVVAYVNDVNVKSVNPTYVVTSTAPKSTLITQYKGGAERVRLRWDTVSAGNGYIIYLRNTGGSYSEFARIPDININEYIQLNLVSGTNYHFMIKAYKVFNGIEYLADQSNEIDVKPGNVIKTTTKAAIYKNNKKVKASKLYKTYAEFAKALDLKKTLIAPGIKTTNVYGFISKNMVTQAITFADKYMLMTAYDYAGEEKSVVYVIDRKTKKYITTMALPDSYHVGGMAFDGYNVWVSTGAAVSCFTYDDIIAAVNSGEDSYQIAYKTKCVVKTQASFVTYYNKKLWIGTHVETKSSKMYGYSISGKKSMPILTQTFSMTIPSRTQDVLFLKDGTMILSRSNQISSKMSKYYISELRKYKPGWGKKKKGNIKIKKTKGKITMPPMMEGISYKSGYIYTSFESASISSCPYKMDRICALKYSKIKWKK